MSIFGPGSEWFWAMTQAIVFSITLIAIYRQLRAQRSSNALELRDSLNKQWDDVRALRMRIEVAVHIRQGDGFDAIYPVLTSVCQFFEDMAGLLEERHIDKAYVWDSWGRTIQFWWAVLEPAVLAGRVVESQPDGNAPFEKLAKLMRDLDAKAGKEPFVPDAEFIARRLDAMIAQAAVLFRIEQEARAGAVPAVGASAAKHGPRAT